MTRSFLKILLMATALVPVAAQAQRFGAEAQVNDEARGDRPDRPDRADRPNRPERVRPEGARPDRTARADFGGRAEVAAPDRGDRAGPGNDGRQGNWTARQQSDRQADQVRENWIRNNGQRDAARQTFQGDRGPQPDRPRTDGRPGFDGDQRGRDVRGFDRDRDGNRDGRDGRDGYRDRDGRQGRFQDQQRFGAYGTVQGYGRGQDYGRGQGFGRGYDQRGGRQGAWNRGWRNDTRYGWSSYRASNRGAYRLPRYYAPSGWGSGYRRFGIGFSLNSILYNPSYWIQDPYTYRLPEAYGPYRWVRYYNDALLVDLDSGRVVDTVYDIFW